MQRHTTSKQPNVHVLVFKDTSKTPPARSEPTTDPNDISIVARNSIQIDSDPFTKAVSAEKLQLHRQANLHTKSDVRDMRSVVSDFALAQEILEIGKHFDADYYANEYPDIILDKSKFLPHFCEFGWKEGRNPNAFFDTVSYLLQNKDVARSKINPYGHYLKHGINEGRIVSSSISPSIRSRLLFRTVIRDWVERLRPHIDIDFYRHQLDDLDTSGVDLAAHFAYRGWREGKSPNPSFDVVSWIQAHPVAMRYSVNPLLIQLEADRGNLDLCITQDDAINSSSEVKPPFTNTASADLQSFVSNNENHLKSDNNDKIDFVLSEFDSSFYLACYPDVAGTGIDPFKHFLFTGWREGRNPNAEFDTEYYLKTNSDVRNLGVNPFIHYLTIGRSERRRTRPAQKAATDPLSKLKSSDSEQDQLSILQQEFSKDYYLAAYPDVAQASVDPLLHFFHTGWREGRNPNQIFDTKYYLKVNEDVRDAGLNPYWHYLVSGKSEGRLPRRPGGYRRQIVDAAVEPANRPLFDIDPDEKTISSAELRRKLKASIKGRKGLIVSLSHDCYIRVIGGTQIFVADEQRRFNELGYAYTHISPQKSRSMLADEDPQFLTRIVIDGKLVGLIPIKEITRLFDKLQFGAGGQPSLMIVHCIMGFHVPDVINLCTTLQPERRIFWLHDYSSICEGFNLLRNDAQFCGAPPPESPACRVCVYGNTRRKHLDGIRSLFAACKFDVVSPSLFTLNLWRKSNDLPRNSETAHPHWQLVPKKRPRKTYSSKLPTDPVAVAFVGFPSANKGWPIFSETVQRLTNDPRYRFFHFAAKGTSSLPGIKFIQTEVSSKDRDATQRLLVDNGIDLVMVLSPWPETFSFVAYEAIGAGAKIVCLSDSGNVADLVRSLDCGLILPDGDALIEFFTSGAAASLIKGSKGKLTSYEIKHIGTTATIEGILELAGKWAK